MRSIATAKLLRRENEYPPGQPRANQPNPPALFRRYSASQLCDVIYGIQPMSSELAEAVRTLRRDYAVSYPRLGFCLCESDTGFGASFGLGRSLVELAARQLGDRDPAWV